MNRPVFFMQECSISHCLNHSDAMMENCTTLDSYLCVPVLVVLLGIDNL